MGLPWPIIILGAAAYVLGWAHFNAHMQLSMASLGPIIFLGAASDVLEWAHSNAQMQLPMASLGPIIFLGAAADVQSGPIPMLVCSCR